MRRTGKFYYLTLGFALLTVISCVLVATWNENTPKFNLWFDIVPNGFGGIGLLTSILIVRFLQNVFDRSLLRLIPRR
jgi:hypothetical protein